MKRRVISGALVICLSLLCALSLTACVKKTFMLTEVYGQMKNPPKSIEVSVFDSYVGKFTITDSEQINKVYEYLISYRYYLTDSFGLGNNRNLKLIYGDGKDISMSSRGIYYKGRRYSLEYLSTSIELDIYLQKIGLEMGCLKEH